MPDKDTIRLISQANEKAQRLQESLERSIETEQIITQQIILKQQIVLGNFVIFYNEEEDAINVDYVED